MLSDKERQENRAKFINEIIRQTTPEKTGKLCWDGMTWSDDGTKLMLSGDHGTPSITVKFMPKGTVKVWQTGHTKAHRIMQVDYNNFPDMVQKVIGTAKEMQKEG